MEIKVAPLIIAHNGPITIFLFLVSITADLEVLVPKGGMPSPGDIMILLNWK